MLERCQNIECYIRISNKVLMALKTEEKGSGDMSSVPRGTPLYGQPSWWGEEDSIENKQHCKESKLLQYEHGAAGYTKDIKKEEVTAGKEDILFSLCREPSYFEIPSKESQLKSDGEENLLLEIPTKDINCSHALSSGHASFTIEFDNSSPGKVTIKDHVRKVTPDHRQKSKKALPSCIKDLSGLQTEMMAAECKVADWLAQNNPPLLRKDSQEEDTKSIKSDVPVYLKRLKGNKHEDGTQSDYENSGAQKHVTKIINLDEHLRMKYIEQKKSEQRYDSAEKHQDISSQTAFMIEFFDDDHPRKRRSYSFTQNACAAGPEAPYPIPQSRIEKVKAASDIPKGISLGPQSGSSSHRVIHSTQHAKLLLKQKSEEPCAPLLLSQNVLLRSSGSLGQRPSKKRVMDNDLKVTSVSGAKKEHEDDLSDKATCTIELELLSPEEIEAQKMNDKVGSFLNAIESSGRKRWVSQWASLASNHMGQEQENGIESDLPASFENDADISESGMSMKSSGSATSLTSQNDRVRRALPQPPKEEITPRITTVYRRSEIGEKQDTELQEKETPNCIHKKDKLSFSEARGLPKIGNVIDDHLKLGYKTKHDQREQNLLTSNKLASKQITVPHGKPKDDTRQISCLSEKTVFVLTDNRKNPEIVSNSHSLKSIDSDKKEPTRPLVRQGSFTIDKPSTNVPIELIPRINRHTGSSPTLSSVHNTRERSDSVDTDSSMDTTLLLKDTEAVMAFLEAKLRDESKTDDGPETPSYTQDNSISPESDVDTASTISLAAGDAEKKCPPKRKSFSNLYKEKSSSPSKELLKSASVNKDKSEKKAKTRTPEVGHRNEIRKVLQTNDKNRQTGMDMSSEDQTSSFPQSDLLSNQENCSEKMVQKCQFNSTDELLHPKLSKDKGMSSKAAPTNKSITLPRPRPTRTSLLRRSRLGEASDSEIGDTDKASVASEVSTTSSTSKPPTGKKALSRIDLLAQPRRTRLGSLSARSDSEATVSRSPGSLRPPESVFRSGMKTSPPTDIKGSPRARANSISRLSEAKIKMSSSQSSPPVNVRWRRTPPEYASTSEDEFGPNRNSLKPARLRTSPAKGQRLQPTGIGSGVHSVPLNTSSYKHRMREQEDYIRDWTAHREEIAR
ncbi:hypothetical protein GDO86_009631 [Hymenochirus boettgeri]|uniref:CEP170 C-terminal domain-containing protein n=1 Tax=Hymenochirus boettgeri TaxID=247094 RepID=A0A8T2JPN7_9PIPI|nr:hypothetical protein GDO86_009631 [Hymenochirus boettgeri]